MTNEAQLRQYAEEKNVQGIVEGLLLAIADLRPGNIVAYSHFWLEQQKKIQQANRRESASRGDPKLQQLASEIRAERQSQGQGEPLAQEEDHDVLRAMQRDANRELVAPGEGGGSPGIHLQGAPIELE